MSQRPQELKSVKRNGLIASFESRVTRGLSAEVRSAIFGQEREPAEVGGILLGRRSGDIILVEDFEPVPSEHHFGPAYQLSDADIASLDESIHWFRHSKTQELRVLGLYRSRLDLEQPDAQDRELMRRFMPEPGSLFLVLRQIVADSITATLSVWNGDELSRAGAPVLFPEAGSEALTVLKFDPTVEKQALELEDLPPAAEIEEASKLLTPTPPPSPPPPRPAPVPEARPVAATPDAPLIPSWPNSKTLPRPPQAADAPAPQLPWATLPPPKPRPVEPPPQRSRDWIWIAGLATLCVVAGVLGFLSVGPRLTPERTVPTSVRKTPEIARQASVEKSEIPPVAPVPAAGDNAMPPVVTPAMEQGVQEALAQWQRAVLSGDPDLLANCYASNFSADEVKRSAINSVARYGRPAILRISELTLTAESGGRAVATFRKHWQTSGPKIYAGEEQERVTFVKTDGNWKIASQEEPKIYWSQRPRG
jgi:hypothetical protein